MTVFHLVLSLLIAWCVLTVWLVVGVVREVRRRELNRRIDEAIALTRPIGPEDSPEWGQW